MPIGVINAIGTDGTFLYVSNYDPVTNVGVITQLNMAGTIVKDISTDGAIILDMAYDSTNGTMYAYPGSILYSFTSSSTSATVVNDYSVNTPAGDGTYIDGNKTTATIIYFDGMTIDGPNGYLYFTSYADFTIRRINLNAGGSQYSISTYIGTKGTRGVTSSLLYEPVRLAYNTGTLYIVDINPSGEPVIRSVADNSNPIAIATYASPMSASPPIDNVPAIAFSGGLLYFNSSNNIYSFNGDNFATIAGTGSDGFVNGNGTSASFESIFSIVTTSTTLFAFETKTVTDVRKVVLSAPYAVTTFLTGTASGGGGAGDPYVTTFSNISYKLPTMDAPIRYFQTMDSCKLLTVNVQLKTVENAELADDTLRSLIVLRKKMTTKQYAAMVAKVMKPETLCFFERISIQYGEQRLVVNLWDSKFELVENTLRCAVEKVDRADLLKKSGGIYSGYTADTVKLTLGRTAVYLSTYASPLVRNGIYIESAALKGANGVVVNALSPGAMTLRSLASVEPVSTRNSLKAVTKVETFVDHDGLRTRNVVAYM